MSIFGMEFLAFGNVTVAVLTLVAVTLLLAVVVQVGIYLLKLGLADDVTGFGKGFKNIVWDKLYETFIGKEVVTDIGHGKIVKHSSGGYLVKEDESGWFYTTTGSDYWKSQDKVDGFCVFPTLEEANRIAVVKYGKGVVYDGGVYLPSLLCIPLVDLTILALQHFLLPTLIVVCFAGFIFVTRLISKMLHKNINKTDDHEGRIKDLAEKVGE